MAKKARESRVNIEISDGLRGKGNPTLPFKMLVVGDFTKREDDRDIYDREPEKIKSAADFESVMGKMKLSLDLSVEDRLSGEGQMSANLQFNSLKDFRPERVADQVPELRKLVAVRDALKAIRSCTGDKKKLSELMAVIDDPAVREKVMSALQSSGGDAATAAVEPSADEPQNSE